MVAAFTTLSGIPSDSTLPFHYSKTKLANSSSVSCDHLRSSQLNRSSNLLLPSGALVFICCFAGKSTSETQNLYCEIKQPFFWLCKVSSCILYTIWSWTYLFKQWCVKACKQIAPSVVCVYGPRPLEICHCSNFKPWLIHASKSYCTSPANEWDFIYYWYSRILSSAFILWPNICNVLHSVWLHPMYVSWNRCCGSQIIGCYTLTGEHCEKPLEVGKSF